MQPTNTQHTHIMNPQLRITTTLPAPTTAPPRPTPLATARLAVLHFCQSFHDLKTRHFAFRAHLQERLNYNISFHHYCVVEQLYSEDVLGQMHANNVTLFRNFAEMRRMWEVRERNLLERLAVLERAVWRLEIEGLQMRD
ncbi:uncharacterized protein LAJ45_11181 [Morchella importuna]|uniref:uncharacterized protein n=1 Tax=Morchella importuna TaxID=1174673 RepID=UPI001E8D768C|nr:uncharacterized protein LAJ45_11181 [Morchella importuna]KAH8144844.1 hypothetical protein LAJ45_11181 [Morchella importuna]